MKLFVFFFFLGSVYRDNQIDHDPDERAMMTVAFLFVYMLAQA